MPSRYYLTKRQQYQPDNIKLVIIAESPPVGDERRLYFYDPTGKPTEPLFAALMQQIGFSPTTKDKKEGLHRFKEKGWMLVDATYQQVNKLKPAERNEIIRNDYSKLHADLKKLIADRPVPVILIKVNVYQILKPKLEEQGFNVINGYIAIPFPSHGQQKKFAEKFSAVLNAAGIESGE